MKMLVSLFLLLGFSNQLFAQAKVRNESHRYWLLRDNMEVDDVMRDREQAFYLDVKGGVSKGLFDFASDIETTMDNNDDAAALSLIQQNINSEKNLNGRVELGIPLHFGAYEFGGSDDKPAVRFTPQLKASAELGASMSITEGQPTGVNFTDEQCQLLRDFLGDPTFDCDSQLGNDPFINIYAQMTTKVGLNLDFQIFDNFEFGAWIYSMTRQDRSIAKTATQLVGEEEIIDLDKNDNKSSTLNTDLRLAYRNKNLLISASVRELKLSGDTFNEDTGIHLIYGNNPLYHLHSQYTLRALSWIKITPFAGAHKRGTYDWSDGWYAGSDLVFTTTREWFQLGGTLKVDPYFSSIVPRVRLFDFLELSMFLKTPNKTAIEGIEQATIFGGNLRLRFVW